MKVTENMYDEFVTYIAIEEDIDKAQEFLDTHAKVVEEGYTDVEDYQASAYTIYMLNVEGTLYYFRNEYTFSLDGGYMYDENTALYRVYPKNVMATVYSKEVEDNDFIKVQKNFLEELIHKNAYYEELLR